MDEQRKAYPHVPDYERAFIGRSTLNFIRRLLRDPETRAILLDDRDNQKQEVNEAV